MDDENKELNYEDAQQISDYIYLDSRRYGFNMGEE
jgi:hypothetical protein